MSPDQLQPALIISMIIDKHLAHIGLAMQGQTYGEGGGKVRPKKVTAN